MRVCGAAGSLSCVEAAESALRILHELVRLQAAVDVEGSPLQPLPIVHRTLASPPCLLHIAQVASAAAALVGALNMVPYLFARPGTVRDDGGIQTGEGGSRQGQALVNLARRWLLASLWINRYRPCHSLFQICCRTASAAILPPHI